MIASLNELTRNLNEITKLSRKKLLEIKALPISDDEAALKSRFKKINTIKRCIEDLAYRVCRDGYDYELADDLAEIGDDDIVIAFKNLIDADLEKEVEEITKLADEITAEYSKKMLGLGVGDTVTAFGKKMVIKSFTCHSDGDVYASCHNIKKDGKEGKLHNGFSVFDTNWSLLTSAV